MKAPIPIRMDVGEGVASPNAELVVPQALMRTLMSKTVINVHENRFKSILPESYYSLAKPRQGWIEHLLYYLVS
jgi:hypothetical protein